MISFKNIQIGFEYSFGFRIDILPYLCICLVPEIVHFSFGWLFFHFEIMYHRSFLYESSYADRDLHSEMEDDDGWVDSPP